MEIAKYIRVTLVLFGFFFLALCLQVAAAQEPDGNRLANPGFESGIYFFQDGIPEIQTAEGWWAYWRESPPPGLVLPNNCLDTHDTGCYWARPEFQPVYSNLHPNRVHSGNHAQKYFSWGRMHEAGLFQHVEDVPEGSTLRFSVWMMGWMCHDPNACRGGTHSDAPANLHLQVGIDPNGGWDPWNASIIWSPAQEAFDEWKLFQVEAQVAPNTSSVTVFTRSRAEWDYWPRRNNDVYVDDANLEVIQVAYMDQVLPAPRLVTYTVSEGDTLFSIALRYGLTPDQLADLNKLPPNFRLAAGDTLWVPWRAGEISASIQLANTATVSEAAPLPIATWPVKTPDASPGASSLAALAIPVVLGALVFAGVMVFVRWLGRQR